MKKSGMGDHVNVVYEHQTLEGRTEVVRKEFFSEVPCSLLRKLYQLYKMDFEIFGYTPRPFLKMCDENDG